MDLEGCRRNQLWSVLINHAFANLKGRGHLEDLSIDWMIILEWILGK